MSDLHTPEINQDPREQLIGLIQDSLTRPDTNHSQINGENGELIMDSYMLALPLEEGKVLVSKRTETSDQRGEVAHVRIPGAIGLDSAIHGDGGFFDLQFFGGGKVDGVNVPTTDGENSRPLSGTNGELANATELALSTLRRAIEANPLPEKARKAGTLGKLALRRNKRS